MDLSICIFVAFVLLFRFACFLLLFCFFCFFPGKKPKKKAKKSKSKKQKKSNKNANGQVHCFPIFSPFWRSFFFPFILLPVFFGFEVLLFEFPCVFLFFAFFSSLKNIRISYRGGHKPTQVEKSLKNNEPDPEVACLRRATDSPRSSLQDVARPSHLFHSLSISFYIFLYHSLSLYIFLYLSVLRSGSTHSTRHLQDSWIWSEGSSHSNNAERFHTCFDLRLAPWMCPLPCALCHLQ